MGRSQMMNESNEKVKRVEHLSPTSAPLVKVNSRYNEA